MHRELNFNVCAIMQLTFEWKTEENESKFNDSILSLLFRFYLIAYMNTNERTKYVYKQQIKYVRIFPRWYYMRQATTLLSVLGAPTQWDYRLRFVRNVKILFAAGFFFFGEKQKRFLVKNAFLIFIDGFMESETSNVKQKEYTIAAVKCFSYLFFVSSKIRKSKSKMKLLRVSALFKASWLHRIVLCKSISSEHRSPFDKKPNIWFSLWFLMEIPFEKCVRARWKLYFPSYWFSVCGILSRTIACYRTALLLPLRVSNLKWSYQQFTIHSSHIYLEVQSHNWIFAYQCLTIL